MPITQLQKCRGAKMRPLLRAQRCTNKKVGTPPPPHASPLITWMPARLPGTSLKCANAKRHLHLHTKCKRNSTRALTTECEGRGRRDRNWGQALCQLEGVELCVWGGGVSWSSYLGALMWATRIRIQIQHCLLSPPHAAPAYCCCSCAFAHFIIFYDFWQRCEKACVTSGQPHVYPINACQPESRQLAEEYLCNSGEKWQA